MISFILCSIQVAASDGKDSSRGAAASYDKAKGRLKEERRALKLLMTQAMDERGALATQSLVRSVQSSILPTPNLHPIQNLA